jgi:predicted transport protein
LNSGLAKLEHWNKDEIEKRAKQLTDVALEIWPMPNIPMFDLEKYKQNLQSELELSYTEDDHFENGSEFTRRLYETLKPAILSFAPDIHYAPKKQYIAFIHNRNFVDIVFYRSQLNLYLNIKKGTLQDSKGIAKDVSSPGHGHWGNGDYVIILKEFKNIEYILPLIKQSYEEN